MLSDEELLEIAGLVSDGVSVDWDVTLEGPKGPRSARDQKTLHALHDIVRIKAFHRGELIEIEETPHRVLGSGPFQRWGHLEIQSFLGGGGFATVYRARDPKLDREVALKLLKPTKEGEARYRQSVIKEGRLLARIKHPNVATVYGADEHDGRVGIWIELIRGKSLSRLLEEQGPLSEREAALIGLDVCRALSAVHARGVLHRDIKAQNVIREEGGRIVLMDFGIGQEIHGEDQPSFGGTPRYIAPEIFEGKSSSVQSDLYALGVLLHHLLTGSFPVSADTVLELVRAHRDGKATLLRDACPGLSESMLRVVERALDPDPSKRYPSAGAMERELAKALHLRSGRPLSLRLLSMTGTLFLLVGGVGYWVTSDRGPSRETAISSLDLDDRPSIAVLLFQNRTGDPSLDWLRMGLADLVVTDLAQSPRIDVMTTDQVYSVMNELNEVEDPVASPELVRKLTESHRADHVVTGSFHRAGEALRVTIQIQDGRTGRIVATRVAEGQGESSLFSLADRLSVQIRSAVRIAPEENELMDRELAEVTTASSEAFRYYAEALNLQYRGKREESIPLFEKAVEVDPGFAMALTKLSVLYMHQGLDEKAFEYSKRALDNIDRISQRERFYVEGNHYSWRESTYEKAIDAYKHVVQMYPDHFPARSNLAALYFELEAYDNATELLEEIRSERPDLLTTYEPLSLSYAARGDFVRGHQVLLDLKNRGENNPWASLQLGNYLSLWGRSASGRQAYETAIVESRGALGTDEFWRVLVLEEAWPELDRWLGETMAEGSVPLDRAHGQVMGLLYRGQAKRAREILSSAFADNPHRGRATAAAHRIAANILLETDRTEEALKEAALAMRDGAGDLDEWQGLFVAAIANAKLERWEIAYRFADMLTAKTAAIPSARTRRRTHHLAGRIALIRGQADHAIEELEKAEALLSATGVFSSATTVPDHVPIWFSLTSAHLSAGDDENAKIYLQRIIASHGERLQWPLHYVRSLYQLAEIYERAGAASEAREYFLRFLTYWQGGDIDRSLIKKALDKVSG